MLDKTQECFLVRIFEIKVNSDVTPVRYCNVKSKVLSKPVRKSNYISDKFEVIELSLKLSCPKPRNGSK